MKEIKFVFDNDEAAKQFVVWLCEQGEQEYWAWMEQVQTRHAGPVTAVNFDYFNNSANIGENPIIATCGRLQSERFARS